MLTTELLEKAKEKIVDSKTSSKMVFRGSTITNIMRHSGMIRELLKDLKIKDGVYYTGNSWYEIMEDIKRRS